MAKAAAAAAAPPQGPKPAAPPPPPIQAPAPVSSGTDQKGAANALFSEINKAGTNISSGLLSCGLQVVRNFREKLVRG